VVRTQAESVVQCIGSVMGFSERPYVASMASGATLQHTNPLAQRTGASSGHFSSPKHPYLSVSTPKFIADSLGPVTMPPGKEPHREQGRTLCGRHTRRRTTMNRKGLWAGGLALSLLIVVGAAALTSVGAGYATDEDASRAKCSEATLKGTYLFAQNGVRIKGNDQRPFALAGFDVFDGQGEVKGVASGNFDGKTFRNDRFSGTYTVKADCTGTLTIRDGAATHGDVFIAPDGSKYAFVRTDPEDVAAGIDPQVTAKRVGE
jgi:hypothetical protein